MPSPLTLDSFSPPVRELLTQAGWYPGRNGMADVRMPTDIVYPPHIYALLAEFAGLSVFSSGPGVNVARSSIKFDPMVGQSGNKEDGQLTVVGEFISKRLYTFGELYNQVFSVSVAADEKLYLTHGTKLFGNTFVEGISNILLGIDGKWIDSDFSRIPKPDEVEFPAEVEALFEAADPQFVMTWREDLSGVRLPNDVLYPDEIKALLAKYAGLHVRAEGPGIDGPRHSIELDPWRAEGENGVGGLLTRSSERADTVLFPLGRVPGLAALLCLATTGRVYLAGAQLVLAGDTFAEGISNMLRGVRGQVLA
jgi:hypothetical protein